MTKKRIIATAAIAAGATAIALGAFFGISAGVSQKKIYDYIEEQCVHGDIRERITKIEKLCESKDNKTRLYKLCDTVIGYNGWYREFAIQISVEEASSWVFFSTAKMTYFDIKEL